MAPDEANTAPPAPFIFDGGTLPPGAPTEDAPRPARRIALVALPEETPAPPPSPTTFSIQAPSPCRIVEVVIGHAGKKTRRPAIVTNTFGGDIITATAFTDAACDAFVFGEPCPPFVRCAGFSHDDGEDAPTGTWRFPPPCRDKIDVER